MKFLLLCFLGLFLFACDNASLPKVTLGTMTDSRDGQTYKTVKIGSQTWMAQNLNYKTDSSFCYNDDTSKCAKYGRFYTLANAVDKPESECGKGKACRLPPGNVQGVCPSGWHLPSKAEWNSLIVAAGGISSAGKVLKSTSGWEKNKEPLFSKQYNLLGKILDAIIFARPLRSLDNWLVSGNGSDAFSFSVFPVGCRTDIKEMPYYSEGWQTNFWTSSISGCSSAELVSFHYDGFGVGGGGTAYGDACTANSVRCVKDENVRKVEKPVDPIEVTVDSMTDSRDGQTYKTVKIGSQTWMAQNLNYEMDDSYCNHDDAANCTKYGRIYKWNAANSACPEGWYLPSKAEWDTLFATVGGDSIAGKVLKSSSGWYACGDGTDAVSFSVLPAGYGDGNGEFWGKGSDANFWSSTKADSGRSFVVEFGDWFNGVKLREHMYDYEFPVRCLKGKISGKSAKSTSGFAARSSPNDSRRKWVKKNMTDFRDGKTYKTVKIGSQTWMAENLNFEMANSYCYKDSASYCNKYGRLYTWAAANSACPKGWHLPSETEWKTLFRVVDKRTSIGTSLKSASGWNGDEGLDSFGFSALPAGKRRIEYINGRESNGRKFTDRRIRYSEEGGVANFWGSTEAKDSENREAYMVYLSSKRENAGFFGDKEYAYSVRCLRD